MDPSDFDTYMRRVNNHIAALEDRVAALEELESLAVPVWDDIRVSVADLQRPTSQAPTWGLWNYGIGGGVTFQALGFGPNERVDLYIQTSHAMKLETLLSYHFHWSIPSNSAGDRFQFQADAIYANPSGAFAVVPGSPFTSEVILDGTEAGAHNIDGLAQFDSLNDTVSTAFIVKLTRISASVNEYGSEVYIFFTDGHFQVDALGSRQLFTK